MQRKKFYDSLRLDGVNLTTQNVIGMEKHLDYAEEQHTAPHFLPYILATSYWESAGTMTPVVEAYWLSEAWRKKNLRYYPFHGRGLIQVTWKQNYEKVGKELGVDIINHPEWLLTWDVALPALFLGMEHGWYTGKGLATYIDGKDEPDSEDMREFKNARRIVNGTDKDTAIAKLALKFEEALKAGGYDK